MIQFVSADSSDLRGTLVPPSWEWILPLENASWKIALKSFISYCKHCMLLEDHKNADIHYKIIL